MANIPKPASAAVQRAMQAQRTVDTAPEMTLRRLLHAMGLRYRIAVPVPGMPRRTIDICFPRLKLGIFVDGCFWHLCPQHAVLPKNNADWWKRKLLANSRRDAATSQHLESLGWTVLRFWEHDDPRGSAEVVAEKVQHLRAVNP